MGDGRIFLKTRRDVSFNKVQSNEPTFRPYPSHWTVPLKEFSFMLYVVTYINPNPVYLIDMGNEGRVRDSRPPPPNPPGDLFLTGGPDESR